jgi:hypothetical protein
MLSDEELGSGGATRSNLDAQTMMMHKYERGETPQQQARRLISTPAIGRTRRKIVQQKEIVI